MLGHADQGGEVAGGQPAALPGVQEEKALLGGERTCRTVGGVAQCSATAGTAGMRDPGWRGGWRRGQARQRVPEFFGGTRGGVGKVSGGTLISLLRGRGRSIWDGRRRPASGRHLGGRRVVGGWDVGHGSSISAGIPR